MRHLSSTGLSPLFAEDLVFTHSLVEFMYLVFTRSLVEFMYLVFTRSLVEFMYPVFTLMQGESYCR